MVIFAPVSSEGGKPNKWRLIHCGIYRHWHIQMAGGEKPGSSVLLYIYVVYHSEGIWLKSMVVYVVCQGQNDLLYWSNLVIYCNGKAVILTTLYSLAALEVVMVTTSSAANDYKVVNVSLYISISVSHGQSWYDTLHINAKVVNRSHIEMFGVRTSSTMTGTHVSGRVIKFNGFP